MDHKSWPWKKKSSEKIIIETDDIRLPGTEKEFQKLLAEKAELENNLKIIVEDLSSVLAENEAKDELLKKHENVAQEAIAGWDETKVAAMFFKQKLDEALIEKAKGDERITQLDDALKDCMEKLRFVQEEQGQKIHSKVSKTSNEHEKHTMVLEMKFAEISKKLSVSDAENTKVGMALLAKDNIVERLNKQMAQAEIDISILTARLKSKEKDNASLQYEIQVLERQLEIRNEEREVSRRASEASHKRHLENVRKLARLESECQRLRLLVRKKLPSAAAFTKMKTDMEITGRDSIAMRRMFNASPNGMIPDFERINNLSEQLYVMEEENKNLREALSKKIDELKFSRNMYSRTASKLLEIESSHEESSNSRTNKETTMSSNAPNDAYVTSISDFENEDKASCTESWSSTLISEPVHFDNKKQKSLVSFKDAGASEMTLMDDFVEMEKLALVSVDNPPCSSPISSAEIGPSQVTGKEITHVSDSQFNSSVYGSEVASESFNKLPSWLHDVMEVVFEHKLLAHKSAAEVLEDIEKALSSINQPSSSHFLEVRKGPNHHVSSNASLIQSNIYLNPSKGSTPLDTSRREPNADESVRSHLNESICKVIKLVEGINLQLPVYGVPELQRFKDERHSLHKKLGTPSDYVVRAFQWKTTDLSEVLQQFLHVCYDLSDGKASIDRFAQELSSAMDWVVNHCFSLQDVSSMREEIKNQFEWDEQQSETESEVGVIGKLSDREELCYSSLSISVATSKDDNLFQKEDVERRIEDNEDVNTRSRDEFRNEETEKIYFKGMLQPAASMAMVDQFKECEKNFTCLQNELKTLKNSRSLVGDGVETQKLEENIYEQPAETRSKYSAIKTDFENLTSNRKEEESMCRKMCLPESVIEHEVPSCKVKQEETQALRTEREITAASEKLAECQETILHLGKQLNALSNAGKANAGIITAAANPTNVPAKKLLTSQRSSLLDHMMAEDSAENPTHGKSAKADREKDNPSSTVISNEIVEALEHFLLSDVTRIRDGDRSNSSSIVPRKKEGIRGIWKKLLWKKRKRKQKTRSPLVAS